MTEQQHASKSPPAGNGEPIGTYLGTITIKGSQIAAYERERPEVVWLYENGTAVARAFRTPAGGVWLQWWNRATISSGAAAAHLRDRLADLMAGNEADPVSATDPMAPC
ncbi:hypothetical protein [Natronoglycomyces albus]|uniref:Uncharacterized protein n=1 Tax=Natronoglycomyces albus TaxID=2811108 RepID=A0A895XS19_9ACTN|nr:hypothetical protein [Natronoglycomyces albus]QSB05995.1 hypothetical protein JQS30_03465 [Natronoglycomyces albus]